MRKTIFPWEKLRLMVIVLGISSLGSIDAGGAEPYGTAAFPAVTMTPLSPVNPPAVRYSGFLKGRYVYLAEGGTLYHVCIRAQRSETGQCANLTVGDTLDAPAARVFENSTVDVQVMSGIDHTSNDIQTTTASLDLDLRLLRTGPAGLRTGDQRWHISNDGKDVLMYSGTFSKGILRPDVSARSIPGHLNFLGLLGKVPFSLTSSGILNFEGHHLNVSREHIDRVAWDRGDLALLSRNQVRLLRLEGGKLISIGTWNVPAAIDLCFTPHHLVFTGRQGVYLIPRRKQVLSKLVSSQPGGLTCNAEADQFILFQNNNASWRFDVN